MNTKEFDKEKLIRYWLASSEDDFETMESMYHSKRYSWTLFIGHLMIEKLMKAYFVKVNDSFPPYIHNLLRLAEMTHLELNEGDKIFFVTVTAFNINSRYDDYKMSFQKKCTPQFTDQWRERLIEKRIWIKELIIG